MTVTYGNTGHWNFGDYGWAVHGHAKTCTWAVLRVGSPTHRLLAAVDSFLATSCVDRLVADAGNSYRLLRQRLDAGRSAGLPYRNRRWRVRR